ncbi:FtsW/RodA/SpoVE family cell cycle protein [Rhabdobacter roseus]|uniref:Probable peptidoglycan glycosyltransferase FtsW n=1 Tax=Rhabdobacter roseus TaxID=1655419 RepID=A0A840TKU7_9BACT|nr:FtsW/RodA/SpoVE family cell cycle protein [Rhabdobacter roseus]MBB5284806.1 cell division protein FtsW [Rhabdobacter roseus]
MVIELVHRIKEDTQSWFSQNLKGDRWIWAVCIFLMLWSIPVVYSASVKDAYRERQGNTEYYLIKHSLLCLSALVIMYFVHRVPYIKFARFSRLSVWISVPLLLFAAFNGKVVNDAARWIEIPLIGQRFQPSEFAKVALITHLSLVLAKHIKGRWSPRELLTEPVLLVGIVCGLIFPSNVSTAVLLAGVCILLMYVGKVPVRYLFLTGLALAFFATVTVVLRTTQRSGTAQSRVQTFFNPDTVVYQSRQSYMAMARGGIRGEGVAKSRQRRFLPEPQKDFIFAITVEEYGTLGGLALMLLFLTLLYRGLKAIDVTKRPFGGLLSAGLTFSIVFQALTAMAVTVGLLPVTGQTLPLFSQGGTSMWFTGLAVGMMLSISRGEFDEKNI